MDADILTGCPHLRDFARAAIGGPIHHECITPIKRVSLNMSSYKDPGFQERTALARQAKQKALDQLRAKPAVDEAVLAERSAARRAREEAEAAVRLAKQAAREQAKADKRALAQARALEDAAAVEVAATRAVATEAEKKAARDARYAARKKGKSSR